MIEQHLGRKFHWKTCNCWELTREVWQELTGQHLPFHTPEPLTVSEILRSVGRGLQQCLDQGMLVEQAVAVEPSLVLFQHKLLNPHGGVFVGGMVLHVTPFDHVRHEPLDVVMDKGKFTEAKFFTCPSPPKT